MNRITSRELESQRSWPRVSSIPTSRERSWSFGARRWLGAGLVAGRRTGLIQAQRSTSTGRSRPILAKNCFACHGQDEAKRARGLRLDVREAAVKPLKSGETAIVPGDPESSALIFRVTEDDETVRMPPAKSGNRLAPAEIDVLRRWIEQGADYARTGPGSLPRPSRSPRSRTRHGPATASISGSWPGWSRKDSKPSPEADRYTLLRRASLDLRGLPPTPREVERFIQDHGPDAFERAVDRFLDDPAYGERWARMWLDLARYADSAGLGSDPLRPNIWRYRDWVDRRLQPQRPLRSVHPLADRRRPAAEPQPRRPDRHRLPPQHDDQHRGRHRRRGIPRRRHQRPGRHHGQVWMGLTLGCAKCHSHKFDPITHEEYYQLYAFFNQSADNDQPDERPVIPALTPEYTAHFGSSRRGSPRPRQTRHAHAALAAGQSDGSRACSGRRGRAEGVPKEILAIVDTPAEKRTKPQSEASGPPLPHDRAGAEADPRRARRAGEVPAQGPDRTRDGRAAGRSPSRDAHVFARGTSSTPAIRSSRACPRRCIPARRRAPANRLGLARWLIDPRTR